MTMHECPECGLAHDEPRQGGEDPMVKVAKIEADRDVKVAEISAGVSREEMLRELEALRAELTVRREEPPVAETEVIETVVEAEPEPEVIPVPGPGPEPEPEGTPPPPETEASAGESGKDRRGWWDGYR